MFRTFGVYLVLASAAAAGVAAAKHDVMAIYFGDWHVDPDMARLHGESWTEWEVVVNAQPKWSGHLQPNLPVEQAPAFGRDVAENVPATMEGKVAAALDSGVDIFMFDWYWYAEQGRNAQGGGFLNGALDDGFLPLTDTKMKFSMMWANQDWVDLHPAKKGWHASGRGTPDPLPIVAPGEGPRGVTLPKANMLLQYDGYMNASVYTAAFTNLVTKYFVRPNYYKVPTVLANGTTADCAYFAIYQMSYLVGGVGGKANAAKVLDSFRSIAEAHGVCLHLVDMVAGSPANVAGKANVADYQQYGVNSATSYCFMKIVHAPPTPMTEYINYTEQVGRAVTAWTGISQSLSKSALGPGFKFAPTLSVGWDSSPRTLSSDPFGQWGYPWGNAFHSTPAEFQAALEVSKSYLDQYCSTASGQHAAAAAAAAGTHAAARWCPPLLINAWNEWSEGAYLEPDQRYGMGKLQALKAVFGKSKNSAPDSD